MRAALVAILAACQSGTSPAQETPPRIATIADASVALAGDASIAVRSTHDAGVGDASIVSPPATAPTATLRLASHCEGGVPTAIDIALTLRLDGMPAFSLDDVVYGSPGMAALVSDGQATDARGALPLVRERGSDLGLTASRRADGEVTLRYRARSVAMTERGARFGLRHDATGIGGLGAFFLVLPESRRVERVRIVWEDARDCPAAMHGTASVAELVGELDQLRMVSFFFGRPQLHAIDDGALHLRAAWFGAPALDTAAASAWAARAFAAERGFFHDDDPTPYTLFVRVLPDVGERAQGMGQPSSFLSAIGPRTPFGPRLRTNIAHEMLHRWLGLRLRLAGDDNSLWFTEGFTVHYANVLMTRAGLISPDDFVAEVNGIATRHFANPRAAATNAEIGRDFFADDAVSVVPYTRGALYAAELDAAIRAASHGARTLDDVVRELYAQPQPLPATAVRAAVQRELGRAGAARYDAVIERGATPDPPTGAYGPCLERVARPIARYELGFADRGPAITKLAPGSAAARAGLRDGDEVISVDAAPMLSDREVTVTVRRRGETVVVRYLPAGPTRDGFGWARVPGCR